MTSVTVREADPDELDALADMWVALAEEQRAYGSHLVTEKNRTAIRDGLARNLVSNGVRVAAADDIVGFVTFGLESSAYAQDLTRGVVQNLYVVAERRNEGIGGRLLDAAETALAALGADAVTLEALAANDAACRFYEQADYRPHRVTYEKRVESDTKEGG